MSDVYLYNCRHESRVGVAAKATLIVTVFSIPQVIVYGEASSLPADRERQKV